MSDQQTPDLKQSLDDLKKSFTQLQQVLDVLFQSMESKGVKPSFHLEKAMTTMNKRVQQVEHSTSKVLTRAGQLDHLVRTSALITSSLDLDQVVEEVLDTVIGLTGAERTYLMLYDDDNKLVTHTARNWDQKSLDENEVKFSQSIIEAAIKDREPILTTNAQTDERFGGKESIVLQKLRSILCIPLMMGGRIVGVLYSDNRFTKDLFEQDLIPILSAFGSQAAIAIHNAQTFGDVKETLEEAHHVIMQMQIEIDRARVDKQVTEITDTDYFRSLSSMANDLRQQYNETRLRHKQANEQDNDEK